MSLRAMGRVWDHSQHGGTARLILLKIADVADDDGVTGTYGDTTIPDLARAALVDRATVQRNLRRIEGPAPDGGPPELAVIERGSGNRATRWQVLVGLPRDRWHPVAAAFAANLAAFGEGPQNAAPAGAAPARPQGPHAERGGAAPVRPPVKDVGRRDVDGGDARAREPRWTVNRKPVTAAERELAGAILDEFNRWAGTSYTLAAHHKPIVGRIREHPDLDAAAHAKVIEHEMLAPWWEGVPSPEVIYGNAAQFERCLQRTRADANGHASPQRAPDEADVDRERRRRRAAALERVAGGALP